MALRPIHGRAVWARAPREAHAQPHRALAAGLDHAVGRLAEQGDVAGAADRAAPGTGGRGR